MIDMERNRILKLSFEFGLLSIRLSKMLRVEKEFVIADQLLRSGTSIGANVFEAQSPVSKKDFYFKLSLASKEAYESWYWLSLIKESEIKLDVSKEIMDVIESIVKILNTILKHRTK